jgi:hypothetical protein
MKSTILFLILAGTSMAARADYTNHSTAMVVNSDHSAMAEVFSNITPAQYATLAQKVSEAGIALSGLSGTASKFGVQIAWNYVEAAHQLTIQVLHTSFFQKPEDVYTKINQLVQDALGINPDTRSSLF